MSGFLGSSRQFRNLGGLGIDDTSGEIIEFHHLLAQLCRVVSGLNVRVAAVEEDTPCVGQLRTEQVPAAGVHKQALV